jgi:hypothetical protein
MTLTEFIILLVVAAIAGVIGQSLGGYKRIASCWRLYWALSVLFWAPGWLAL